MTPGTSGKHAVDTYPYEVIESTSMRLVRLKPGAANEPIRCELLTTSAASAPSYEAISYVWGDMRDVQTLQLDNHTLSITGNLYTTLQGIRFPHQDRVIWVDAICINQADLTERAQQVQMMGSIYTHAAHVLIYVGRDLTGSSHEVLQMVSESETLVALSAAQTSAIATLLRCTWFARVWTIQEAALARHPYLIWGDSTIEWRLLVQLLQKIGNQSIAVGDLWHQVGFEWNLWLAHLAYNPNDTRLVQLIRLMYAARGHSATDARDHIFAFLGHPANLVQGKALLKAEYVTSKPEVFKTVTTQLLSSMRTLDVLSYVTHDESYGLSGEKPSWIPNWDQLPCTTDGFQVRVFPFEQSKIFSDRTITSSDDFFTTADDGNTLVLRGRVVDHVEWQAETMIYTMISPGLWLGETQRHPIEQAWIDLKSHLLSRGFDKGDLLKLFSLMLVSGQAEKKEVERRGSAHSANFDAWRSEHSKHVPASPSTEVSSFFHDDTPLSDENASIGEWGRFVSDAFQSCNGRRIFCTANGDLGSGPMAMQPGDVCVSLDGARTPFILRPLGKGDDRYVFIGEAYLHELLFHDDMFWTHSPGEQEFRII